MSAATSPSGFLAVFEIPAQPNFSQLDSGIGYCKYYRSRQYGHPHSHRSALNIKSVVIVDGADVWSPKVIQATAGR